MGEVGVGATTLRYDEEGVGQPPVLLIHGTAAALWAGLPGLLAPRHRVISYDRRGYGGSHGPRPATLAEHTIDAIGLLDGLSISNAVIVGWSVGGIVALDLAVHHPARVVGLVLVEPPLHAKRHPTAHLVGGVVGGMLRGRRDTRAGAARFLRWALRDSAHRKAEDGVPAGWWEGMLANSAAIVHEISLGTGEHIGAADLGGLRCSTVILHGDRSDPAFAKAARRIAAAVPTARLEAVANSGHVMQVDRPDAIVAAVDSLQLAGS
jgi:pimeloyl-ACP methyl ester carboxylesterase